jgi:hypothetical protein
VSDNLITLREVLLKSESFPWGDALYMPPLKPWSLETPCIVHDVDDVEDDERDLPNVVIEHGFEYVLGMQLIQSIVSNLRLQTLNPSESDYLAAFTFYVENDSYMVVS